MNTGEMPITFQKLALGRHLTVEYYECESRILTDVRRMQEIFLAAAKVSGATVLESNFHAFEPQGVSGIIVISESHFAVHAWPEYAYAAVDIFTCGDRIDFQRAVDYLRGALKSRSMVISHVMSRGLIGQNGTVRYEHTTDETPDGVLSWQQRYESADAWGMLASIDLHHAQRQTLSEQEVAKVLESLHKTLHTAPCQAGHCVSFHDPAKGDGLRFVQILNQGTVTGRWSEKRQTFYCDVFLNSFFDPREAAETMLAELHGDYYRLQVALRQ